MSLQLWYHNKEIQIHTYNPYKNITYIILLLTGKIKKLHKLLAVLTVFLMFFLLLINQVYNSYLNSSQYMSMQILLMVMIAKYLIRHFPELNRQFKLSIISIIVKKKKSLWFINKFTSTTGYKLYSYHIKFHLVAQSSSNYIAIYHKLNVKLDHISTAH